MATGPATRVVHEQLALMHAQLALVGARGPAAVPLTPIQRWFFERALPDRNRFNLAWMVATNEPLEPGRLGTALGHLIGRHAVLRHRFQRGPQGWRQTVAPAGEAPPFSAHALHTGAPDEIERIAGQAQASLDIERGPLLRVVHLRLPAGAGDRLLVVLHHLVADLHSWGILFGDLLAIYDQLSGDRSASLPPVTAPFSLWASRLAAHATTPALEGELPHWRRVVEADVARLPDVGAPGTLGAAETIRHTLAPETSRRLWEVAPRAAGVTAASIASWAVASALRELGGNARVRLDVEGHGREDLFPGISVVRTVGWFTCLHPVLLELDPRASVLQQLRAVEAQRRQVPGGGIGFGLLCDGGRMARPAAAQICWNFTGRGGRGATRGRFWEAPEGVGERHDPRAPRSHCIELSGGDVDGRFTFAAETSAALAATGLPARLVERAAAELARVCDAG